jgi:organic radical activating enzyme
MKIRDQDRSGHMLPLVEEFYSVQGEGINTGRAAYFVRVGGCDICCSWCDTKYSWNAELHPMVSVETIAAQVAEAGADSVVVTGGEPLMWNMDPLCDILKSNGIKTFLETSEPGPDWYLGLDYTLSEEEIPTPSRDMAQGR